MKVRQYMERIILEHFIIALDAQNDNEVFPVPMEICAPDAMANKKLPSHEEMGEKRECLIEHRLEKHCISQLQYLHGNDQKSNQRHNENSTANNHYFHFLCKIGSSSFCTVCILSFAAPFQNKETAV